MQAEKEARIAAQNHRDAENKSLNLIVNELERERQARITAGVESNKAPQNSNKMSDSQKKT